MNDDTSSSANLSLRTDAFLPLVLLSLSIGLVFVFQLNNVAQQRTAFQNAIVRQGDAVKQSHQVQANLEKLVRDLLDVAQTDTDAKAIVTKYGIQSNGPAPSPAN